MVAFLTVIQILTCLLLIVVILMQAGRGGGLNEAFQSAESVFGAKTNSFMVRVTTVLAVFFLVSSTSLVYLSSKGKQSLMAKHIVSKPLTLPEMTTNTVSNVVGEDANTVLPNMPDETEPTNSLTNQIK